MAPLPTASPSTHARGVGMKHSHRPSENELRITQFKRAIGDLSMYKDMHSKEIQYHDKEIQELRDSLAGERERASVAEREMEEAICSLRSDIAELRAQRSAQTEWSSTTMLDSPPFMTHSPTGYEVSESDMVVECEIAKSDIATVMPREDCPTTLAISVGRFSSDNRDWSEFRRSAIYNQLDLPLMGISDDDPNYNLAAAVVVAFSHWRALTGDLAKRSMTESKWATVRTLVAGAADATWQYPRLVQLVESHKEAGLTVTTLVGNWMTTLIPAETYEPRKVDEYRCRRCATIVAPKQRHSGHSSSTSDGYDVELSKRSSAGHDHLQRNGDYWRLEDVYALYAVRMTERPPLKCPKCQQRLEVLAPSSWGSEPPRCVVIPVHRPLRSRYTFMAPRMLYLEHYYHGEGLQLDAAIYKQLDAPVHRTLVRRIDLNKVINVQHFFGKQYWANYCSTDEQPKGAPKFDTPYDISDYTDDDGVRWEIVVLFYSEVSPEEYRKNGGVVKDWQTFTRPYRGHHVYE